MSDMFSWPPMPARVVNMREEKFDVRIDRKTKWGNKFIVGKDGSRDECIAQYREWILEQPHLLDSLDELQGKALGCWCKPKACHGDVLIELLEGHISKKR